MGNSSSAQDPKLNKVGASKASGCAIWEWQSNQDPWATDQLPQWEKFPIEKIKMIEKAFQNKKKTVEIGDYIVNLEAFLQIHKEQSWKVRPVRRTEIGQRAMRFCSELIIPRTFGRVTYTGDPTIVEKWLKQRKFNFKIDKKGFNITDEEDMPQLRKVVELAVKGILKEGQKGNWKNFAETLAKRLEDSIYQNPKEIFRECIYIYTDESRPGAPSLYAIANKALREIDYSKVETLGPYCYLLNFALKALSDRDTEFFHAGKVYRGLGLEQDILEIYKTAWKRGLQISFHSFVSTSKSEEVAATFSLLHLQENHKRVLLVIENLGGAYIETLTAHRGEEEVLLPASRGFQITNIDEKNPDLTTIYLKMIDTKLDSLHLGFESPPQILLSHSSFTELPPSLSRWGKGIKVYFEISDDGTNITPNNKSSELKGFVKFAAEGLRTLAETQENEQYRASGRQIAERLIEAMKTQPGDIFKIMVKLYTQEPFLGLQVNRYLGSESSDKLTDLGPFCYLLNSYLLSVSKASAASSKPKKSGKLVTVYRAAKIPPFQIDVLKELYVKNLHFAFNSFISTTTRKGLAQGIASYINAFFVISVPESMALAFDISKFASFREEMEILLPPNVSFKITDISNVEFSSEILQIRLEFIDYVI